LELKDYLRILRRHWLMVTACTVLGFLGAAAASFLVQPVYTSETKLFVALQNSESVSELQQGSVFSQARVLSYVDTVESPVVLQPVIDSLGLDVSPKELAEQVTASAEPTKVLITIAVTDTSPIQSAAIAQAVGNSLVDAVEQLERPSGNGDSPVKLSIITPAVAPTAPSSPNVPLNLLLGLLAGLAIGVGLAVLRTVLDTLVRGEADIRPLTSAPALGGITFEEDAARKPLLTQAPPQSPRAESFRQLRTNLQFAQVSNESRTLVMTSSLPGEGKSTTAINLAIAMAQAGQSVALVDADLRRPSIASYLGLERNAGLTTAIIGRADVNDLLQPWGNDELHVLTAGAIPPNPSELLGSGKMKQLITRLERTFDAVVVDAPPLLPVTDAAVLAQQVGGVVLVVGAQKVRTHEVEKSLASLEMVNASLLGVVLNRLPSKGPDAYAYSYYRYDSIPEQPKRGSGGPVPRAGQRTSAASRPSFDGEVLRGAADPAPARPFDGGSRARSGG
jgi:capsular exopolysaccharide synthesis family protein